MRGSAASTAGLIDRLTIRLFQPVDLAPLAWFRIAFGAIMLWEVWRYFSHGWIARYFIEPIFHFTYFGFEWVRPWPGAGMYVHFAVLGLAAAAIMVGLCYRVAAVVFFAGFTYVFLLEQARYLNHFYLISLVSFLLMFLPAARALSLDARRRPALAAATAPAWTLGLLRFQIAIPYVYGGLAKINRDWLAGEPLRSWLADRTDLPLVGPWLAEEPVVMAFTYGGLALDLLVVPALLYRPTWPWALAAAAGFHLMNAVIFNIGVFPWFMLAATILLFTPGWPRLAGRRTGRRRRASTGGLDPGVVETSGLGARLTVACLALYVVVQLAVPLRHFLYPGNVSWTEQGHLFSWHMKLRDKAAKARFMITDPHSGDSWEVDPGAYLTSWQESKMAARPDLIHQFSQYLAKAWQDEGRPRVQVRVGAVAALNGRALAPLVDPTVDLAAEPRTLWPASWIVPLED